jgi:hypothetical protein
MAALEEKVENPASCASMSLRETAERAIARHEELTAIRRELLLLAQDAQKAKDGLQKIKDRSLDLAQRALELTSN